MAEETIALSDEQVHRAVQMAETLSADSTPHDFLDEWRAAPDITSMEHESLGYQYVPVANIKGTVKMNVDRLDPSRIGKLLPKIVEGEFEVEHERPPSLMKVDDEYYVDNDGIHRSILFKYLGIDEMYADVIEYYP